MGNQLLSTRGLRVLVVDSDLDSRDLLTMMFEMYGIETIATASAAEALEILRHIQPDLLISEIGLPNEDGYSLMSKVKALETARQVAIPSIALSTYASLSDRTRALSVGFCNHLAKPVDIDKLVATISQLLQQFQGTSAA